MNKDRIEFYEETLDRLVCSVDSSHGPDRGDLVNIRKQTYRVTGRTFSVDHAFEVGLASVSCIIILTKEPQG